MAENASKSLMSALKTDYNEIDNREYAIYELALRPKSFFSRKDKFDMMQIINPGFDSMVKVYNDPKAKESKGFIGITGGEKLSYLVVIGNESYKVEKKKYKLKKQFSDIFGNCDAMMKKYSDKRNNKIKWKDFAQHVLESHETCGK